jgi:hypothetical protein
MEKRIVISKSKFKKKGQYMEMVVYKDSQKKTSRTKHEPVKLK